jgi:hypothetical protein
LHYSISSPPQLKGQQHNVVNHAPLDPELGFAEELHQIPMKILVAITAVLDKRGYQPVSL